MSDVFHVCITFVAILGIPCLLTAQSRPQTFIFHEMKAEPHVFSTLWVLRLISDLIAIVRNLPYIGNELNWKQKYNSNISIVSVVQKWYDASSFVKNTSSHRLPKVEMWESTLLLNWTTATTQEKQHQSECNCVSNVGLSDSIDLWLYLPQRRAQ